MMASAALPNLELEPLVGVTATHLDREAAFLIASLEAFREIRQTVLTNDQIRLMQFLRRHDGGSVEKQALHEHRNKFRQAVAAALGVPPEEVRISLIVSRLRGADAERLSQRQEQMLRDAREAQRLYQEIAALIHHCLRFMRRLVLEFFGEPECTGYDPLGAPREAPRGRLIEALG